MLSGVKIIRFIFFKTTTHRCLLFHQVIILFAILPLWSALNEPFNAGYSCATQNTILLPNHISARQSFQPAAFFSDSCNVLFSLSFVNYYSGGSLEGGAFRQALFGGSFQWLNLRTRIGYKHFNALDIYFEQSVMISIGYKIGYLQGSVDLSGRQFGLFENKYARRETAIIGGSLWFRMNFGSLSVRLSGVDILKVDCEGFDEPIRTIVGIHSAPNKLGAQGVIFSISKHSNGQYLINCSLGEELQIIPSIAIITAISIRPVFISFGFRCNIGKNDFAAAFVRHQQLGWSQSIDMIRGIKKSSR